MLLIVQSVIVRATVGLKPGLPSLGLMAGVLIVFREQFFLQYPAEDLVSGCLSC